MKAVIFDLDGCLSPANEVGPEIFEPAFEAIRAANEGSVSAGELDAAFSDMWRQAFDWIAHRYRFSPSMIDAGLSKLSQVEVTSAIRGYDDLHLLSQVPGQRFLVTTGFRRLQESKIRALGIAKHFSAVFIDGLDDPLRKGKRALFEEIIASHNLSTSEVLVVGDNPESELAAGKSLGLSCVQTLRPGVTRSNLATLHVSGLRELIDSMALAT